MSDVAISFATPDPADAPGTFSELVALLNELISGEVTDASTPYVLQAATPSVDQQGFIWYRLDGAGRPIGHYKFYDGHWRRVWSAAIGDIKMLTNDPAEAFDGTGLGLLGGVQDGWALCNGNNGTPDLSDKFIVAAHMDNASAINGYSSGNWRTTVAGAPVSVGGAASVTLDSSTGYYPALPEIKVWKWSADGNAGRNGGNLYGTISTPGQSVNLQDASTGNTSPDPIATVPPFFAVAYAQFVGYA